MAECAGRMGADRYSAVAPKRRLTVSPRYLTRQSPLPPEVLTGLNELTRQLGVSIKINIVGGSPFRLKPLDGQSAVSTGLVAHGRPEKLDGERVLGLFLNTVPDLD